MEAAEGCRLARSTGWCWWGVGHSNGGCQHGRRRGLEILRHKIIEEGEPGCTQAESEGG